MKHKLTAGQRKAKLVLERFEEATAVRVVDADQGWSGETRRRIETEYMAARKDLLELLGLPADETT